MKLIIDIPDEYLEQIKNNTEGSTAESEAVNAIRDGIPYEERPQGEWQYNQYDGNLRIGNWHCSECKHIIYGYGLRKPNYNFCPYCGVKMKAGVK